MRGSWVLGGVVVSLVVGCAEPAAPAESRGAQSLTQDQCSDVDVGDSITVCRRDGVNSDAAGSRGVGRV